MEYVVIASGVVLAVGVRVVSLIWEWRDTFRRPQHGKACLDGARAYADGFFLGDADRRKLGIPPEAVTAPRREAPATADNPLHFGPVMVTPEGDVLRAVSDGGSIWVEHWDGSRWGKGGDLASVLSGGRATEEELVRRGIVAFHPAALPS
jgi:hypothetical protein